jgi:hypothetical protein
MEVCGLLLAPYEVRLLRWPMRYMDIMTTSEVPAPVRLARSLPSEDWVRSYIKERTRNAYTIRLENREGKDHLIVVVFI